MCVLHMVSYICLLKLNKQIDETENLFVLVFQKEKHTIQIIVLFVVNVMHKMQFYFFSYL